MPTTTKTELTRSLRERDLLLLFVGSVIGSGIFLTPGLIQRQVGGSVGWSLMVWLLGGVLIRDLHESPRLRKRPIDQVVLQALDEEGGPLISHAAADDDQQRSFDATCRKFYRFLTDRNSSYGS